MPSRCSRSRTLRERLATTLASRAIVMFCTKLSLLKAFLLAVAVSAS